MADHFNHYPLKHFAATVADCMGMTLPETYAHILGFKDIEIPYGRHG